MDFMMYGLFGEDISGSPAPRIFNAIFEELRINSIYMPFPVSKDRFLTALPVLRSEFSGFNVTAPFRIGIMSHLDAMDESAKRAGTANTVKVKDGKLTGYNTDMTGFARSLIGFLGSIYDRDVLVIGSGGAAHAVANVLLSKGAFVTVVSRNLSHAAALSEHLQKQYNKNRIRVKKGLMQSDAFFAVFNTAAVDLESQESEISIHTNIYQNLHYAYDVSYAMSGFLKKAADFGVKTKDGFDMLYYQAIGSLEVWLGKETGMDVSLITKTYNHIREQQAVDMIG